MSDLLGLIVEVILEFRWLRRLFLGGIIYAAIWIGGLKSKEVWITIAVVGGLWLFLEGLDYLGERKKTRNRGD